MKYQLAKLVTSAAIATAFPFQVMSQETQSFDEQVRQALLNNPEIILEVFAILEAQQDADKQINDLSLIDQYSEFLFGEVAPTDKLVLVEFVDYQCGYCRGATPIIARIMEANPDIELRLIQLPILGPKSAEQASQLLAIAEIYGDEIYHDMHEIFLGGDGSEFLDFDAVIIEHGLSPQLIYDMSISDEIKSSLSANLALARALGINGTPGFVTKSQIVRGFVQEAALLQAIEGS